MYIFIFHIVNQYDKKSAFFCLQTYVLDTILPVFALFRQQRSFQTATALFCVSDQQDGVSFQNESTI